MGSVPGDGTAMSTAPTLGPPTVIDDQKVRISKNGAGVSSFSKLPDEIIEQILHISDPNSFASLILLNTTWRRVSQQAYLYAHHLSRCQSYAASHPAIAIPLTEDQLPLLRSAFAQEVKRNLFEAYLRPRETVINLVSTSISSSAAFPGGEAFHFAFSPNGHHVLAYSSSRIYVINTVEKDLTVKRELKILRRPASVTILDDGSLLAVLSTDHQVDVYDLKEAPPKHIRALELDHAPRTISLAPMGSILAAAYDAGVEVYSLAAAASLTDRRSVKCDAADSLSFSQDGTQLLGTTLNSRNPSTVILTAPYFDPGDCPPEESISQLWTTSILFPHSSRDCSHTILLPSPMDDEASWVFTYDRVFETFRAVRIDDLRNGTTYFTGPIPDLASGNKLLPTTLPTATSAGDLVAAGFQGKEIWLYGVPEDLDSSQDMSQSIMYSGGNEVSTPIGSLARSNSAPSMRSHTWPRDTTSNRIPQWQLLCDKSRNTFIGGRNISALQGISALKWVSGTSNTSCSERLVVVAPGVVGQLSDAEDDGMAPVDGGRFSLLDFDYRPNNGEKSVITIEVGGDEPEVLEEEHRDIDAEVAIVRRRTVAQRGQKPLVLRSATIAGRSPPSNNDVPVRGGTFSAIPPMPLMPTTSSGPRIQLSTTTEEQPETASIDSIDEAQEALDAPYAHGSPRSGTTLRRAATAAAINRRLHPPRVVAQEHIEFRRADGREEHPHESDADNWVPPPPPYTREPIAPVPEHLRNAVLAGSTLTTSPGHIRRSSTQRSSGSTDSNIINALHRSRTTLVPSGEAGRHTNFESQRSVSDPTSLSTSDDLLDGQEAATLGNAENFDELYDVSPPDTPEPEFARPIVPATAIPGNPAMPSLSYQIPRRPVPSSEPARNTSSIAPGENTMRPESPVAQPTVTDTSRRADSRMLQQWEGMIESSQNLDVSRPSTGSSLTQTRLDAPVPQRPNDDHRLTELPPSTPTKTPPSSPPSSPPSQHVQRVEPARPSSLRIETTPATSVSESPYNDPAAGLPGPSASQLARLNSRSGRPSNRILNDPSRRGSGPFAQPQFGYPIHQNTLITRVPLPNAQIRTGPQQYPVWAPPTIPGSLDLTAHSPAGSPSNMQYRQRDFAHPGQGSSSTPSLRPRMQRLDTIHSVTSQGEPATYGRSLSMKRKSSRAGRSAAINIEQAKRRGWGGTRKEKKKDRDGASSAGWTDITRDSYVEGGERKKGSKCAIM